MTVDFFLLPAAARDLQKIWRYTCNTWGEDQADRYIDTLNHAFIALAHSPDMASPCDFIRRGYRKRAVEHHVIYFRMAGQNMEIVRVLHERMDVHRHL